MNNSRKTYIAILLLVFSGSAFAEFPNYQLRWCANGSPECDVHEGFYVQGDYFFKLRYCTDAIKHLDYYGNKLGGTCIELSDSEKQELK